MQFYGYKFEDTEEVNDFPTKYKLLKLPITVEDMLGWWLRIYHGKRHKDQMGLIFKYQMTPMLFKHFQAMETKEKILIYFFKTRLILIPKPDNIFFKCWTHLKIADTNNFN